MTAPFTADPAAGIDPFADVDPFALPQAAPALFEAARGRRREGSAEQAAAPARNRRRAPRFRVAAAAAVRPVDVTGQPIGPAFEAVLADLSGSGIRLLHSRFVRAAYLAVLPRGSRPGTTTSPLVFEVRRVSAAGRYYEFAGPLVSRLDPPAV